MFKNWKERNPSHGAAHAIWMKKMNRIIRRRILA